LAVALFAAALLARPAMADTEVPAEARALFEKAEIAREEGRLEQAADLYKQAINLHPLYEAAHAGYLAALRGAGNLPAAQPFYASLTPKHPGSVELQAFAAAAQEPEAAIAALDSLADAQPDNFRVQLELGRAQFMAGEERDAERSLKAALKVQADSPVARTLLGDVYLAGGKFTRARKEYEAALDTDSAYTPAQLRMALALHRSGDSAEALERLGSMLSEDNYPRLVAGHWLMAIIRADEGKFAEAVQSMDKVLSIDTDDPAALMAKGLLLLRQGQPMEATKIFERVCQVNDRSSDGFFCLGWAFEKAADAPEIQEAVRQERLRKAAEAYDKCAAMDPGVRPRDSLGFVFLLSNKHAEATKQFRRAMDIDKEFAPAHNNFALSQDIADNRTEAKKRYEYVLSKIDKKNIRARVMLALDLWLDGSASKAIKELEKVVKDEPNDDLAWTFLGDIYYDANKVESSLKAYKKAVEINEQNFFAWYHMGIAYEDDKRRYEEAERCYEKGLQVRADPPVEIFLRLGMLNDVDALDRPEKAVQYYQHYIDSGGRVDGDFAWVPGRVEELKALVGK